MNKRMKSALLSGLVLPGLGQIAIHKHYLRGAFFMVSTVLGLGFVFFRLFQIINQLLNEFQGVLLGGNSGDIINTSAILEKKISILLSQQNVIWMMFLGFFLTGIWFLSIVDALMSRPCEPEPDTEKKLQGEIEKNRKDASVNYSKEER